MNSNDLKLMADFIAQRLEMGETEWFFKPEAFFTNGFNGISTPSGLSERESKQVVTGNTILREHPAVEKESCVNDDISDSFIATQESLQKLYSTVCGCMRCGLGQNRTKFVFGDGNPQAGIMFIGEAPGAEEDRQGLPFVGSAGKLLTRMIKAIKLRREDVYIGNILKCRPPGNRDPKQEEIEKCEPILIRQIEIIKPKIICALGRISGQTLLRTKSSLSALRGKVHDYHGVKLMVTYHPAALLRNPKWKSATWEDLKLLRREYDGMEL